MAKSKHTPAASGSKWISPDRRMVIYRRDDFTCVYCNIRWQPADRNLTLDHVLSVREGGRNNKSSNLVTACLGCNSAKQAKSMKQWLAWLKKKGINVSAIRKRIRSSTEKSKRAEKRAVPSLREALRLVHPNAHVDCDCIACRPWTS